MFNIYIHGLMNSFLYLLVFFLLNINSRFWSNWTDWTELWYIFSSYDSHSSTIINIYILDLDLQFIKPSFLKVGKEVKLEKAMAPHSSTLAWKIPWTEEPGKLQSMGLRRVGHSWATSLSLFTFMHWRRKWQPTPVFLPGESQGRRSLVGCCLWGRTESGTTEAT